MNTTDNRVVHLGFDNAQFESGTKTSMNTLDKLKKSLNLDESAKSLTNMSNVAKGFTLGNIAEGVQNVSNKFSALGVIGFTVLQTLTNAALDYGKRIVNNLLDPIKTGLTEYETKLNSIQTVLANTASKGTTLDDVNRVLNQLNEYSDKTIYNFSEMTRNIGTFTAAGVGLEDSAAAIKGIANLAAISGSNSQQAATAMYQLSQALASGTVKLMDWNSVVNAGMGGQVFQDALKETARVHGVAIDDMISKEGSFRETLQNGWLTSDILTETLQKFTGDLTEQQLLSLGYTEQQIAAIVKLGETANDAATKVKTFSQLKQTLQEALQSGWAQSWEIIIGDFEEARSFFTNLSDTFGNMIKASADSRNKILQDWKKFGGRQILLEAIQNIFEGVAAIITPVREAFKEIFPREMLEGQRLKLLTVALRDFTEKLKLSGENVERVKRIFKGIFAFFDILRRLVVALASTFFDMSSSVAPSLDSILEFLARIGDFIVKVREGVKVNDTFNAAILKVKDTLEEVKNGVIDFANSIRDRLSFLKGFFEGLFENIDTGPVDTLFDKINLRFEPLKTLFKAIGALLVGFSKIAQKSAPVLFKIGVAISELFKKLGFAIIEGITNLNFSNLFDMINSGLFAALLIAIRKFVDSGTGLMGSAGGVFGSITGILDGVRGSLEAWQANIKSKTLLTIAVAIGILALSLISLSMIDSQKLNMALRAVTGMFLELMAAMAIYSRIGSGVGGVAGSLGLIALSTSILIMAGAISRLAKLKPDELDQGLGAVTALTFGLVVASKVISKNSPTILKGTIGMIAFSIALLMITKVVENLGALDPARLQNGLIGVGVVLAEIAAFMKLVDLDKMGVLKGTGLLLLAGSIMVISLAVEKFAAMDPAKIQQGLLALGVVLGELAIFSRISGNGLNLIATGVGLTILGAGMLILTEAITRLSGLSWEQLAKGLVGMAGALLVIVAAVNMMPKTMIITSVGLVLIAGALVILSQALRTMGGMTWEEIGKGLVALAGSLLILTIALYAMQGTLLGTAALVAASAALALLGPVLVMLGSLSISEIGIALLALAGVFLLLGIAGYALTPVIPTLFGLALSMMMIGVAAVLVGVGLLAFSVGLAAIAASGGVAAVAIVGMIATILGIIPMIIKTLIDAIIVFGEGIIAAAPVVRDAILALLLGVLDIIIETTPKLLKALTLLLKGLIQLIIDVVPDFIHAVLFLLGELLSELAANMPTFVQAGWDMLLAFLQGFRDNIGEVVKVVAEIIIEFLNALGDELPGVIQAGVDFIIDFINGMADAIDKNMEPMLAAMGRLAAAMITGLSTAITKGTEAVKKALKDIVDAAILAIKQKLGIASPSKVFAEIGRFIPLGLIVGIKKLREKLIITIENLGKTASSKMEESISRINDALNSNMDMNPTIRPILDLSSIENNSRTLDKILGQKSLNIVPVLSRTALVAGNIGGPVPSQSTINPVGTTVTYIQNNHSPKALSNIDIYRQTKNQLMSLKGLVKP